MSATTISRDRAGGADAASMAPVRGRTAPNSLVLAVVLAGSFMAVLDFAIVNLAIPAMRNDLHVGFGAVELVISVCALAYGCLLVTGGRHGTPLPEGRIMQARIENPAIMVPGAREAFQQLRASVTSAGIPETTLQIVELRASQINGCSGCVDIHSRVLEHLGESSERIHLVAAWREAPYFSDAERAVLALTEAATRLADRADPVTDEVWDEAARHFTEPQLAALVVAIATINANNRANVATKQITGEWVDRIAQAAIHAT